MAPRPLEVAFSRTAVVERGRGFASIRRVNRKRAVNVTASVDASVTSAGAVVAGLNTRIRRRAGAAAARGPARSRGGSDARREVPEGGAA